MTTTGARPAGTDTGRRRPTGPRRPLPWLVALVAVWAVSAGCVLAGAGIVLPVLLLAGTASLLRVGETLVDRLVLAAVAMIGTVCAAGLLLSVLPWGLAPLPAAGLGGTVLLLVAALTGRRPEFRLPRRGRDAGVLAGGLAGLAVAVVPLVKAHGFVGRLAVAVPGEDESRHFLMFDGISRYGGYLFFHPGADKEIAPGFLRYPAGSHLVSALLDGFLPGASPHRSSFAAFDHYLCWVAATLVLLAACLAWAAGWLAGDALRGWAGPAALGTVIAAGAFTLGAQMINRGYPSELFGLALYAVLVAVLARPPRNGAGREFPLVLAALLAGLSFGYYFYLVPVAVGLAWWAWAHRDRLRARPVFVLALAAGTLLLMAVTPLVNLGNDPGSLVLLGGPVVPVDRVWLGVLTAVVLAVLAVPAARRLPAMRAGAVALGAAALFAVAVAGYQWIQLGHVSYYFEKAVHGLVVAELVLLGPAALLLTGPARERESSAPARRWTTPVIATLAVLAVLGGFRILVPHRAAAAHPGAFLPVPAPGASYGRAYLEGRLTMTAEARGADAAARAGGSGPSARLVLFWNAYGRGSDFYAGQFANALRRHFDDASWRFMMRVPLPRGPDSLDALLADLGHTRVVIYTRDPAVTAEIDRFHQAHPGTDIVAGHAR